MCLTTEEGRKYDALRNAGVPVVEALNRALGGDEFPVTPADLTDDAPSETAAAPSATVSA